MLPRENYQSAKLIRLMPVLTVIMRQHATFRMMMLSLVMAGASQRWQHPAIP
jgi:hypothetical protein